MKANIESMITRATRVQGRAAQLLITIISAFVIEMPSNQACRALPGQGFFSSTKSGFSGLTNKVSHAKFTNGRTDFFFSELIA